MQSSICCNKKKIEISVAKYVAIDFFAQQSGKLYEMLLSVTPSLGLKRELKHPKCFDFQEFHIMFTSRPEMSGMRQPMQGYTSFFMEEKMVKTTVASSGYKTRKRTISREEGQIYLL